MVGDERALSTSLPPNTALTFSARRDFGSRAEYVQERESLAVRAATVLVPALIVSLTVPRQPCALLTPAGRETAPEALAPLMRNDTDRGATRVGAGVADGGGGGAASIAW